MDPAARTRIKLAYALCLAGAVLGVIAGASDASEHARALAGAIALLLLISGLRLDCAGAGSRRAEISGAEVHRAAVTTAAVVATVAVGTNRRRRGLSPNPC